MNFYHFWVYVHIFNTKWFLWMIIWIVFGLNISGPFIIWYVMNGIQLPFTKGKRAKKKRKAQKAANPSK